MPTLGSLTAFYRPGIPNKIVCVLPSSSLGWCTRNPSLASECREEFELPTGVFLALQGEMSGNAGSLVVADYVVFALMLVVSAAVGFYFAWKSRGSESSRDFLTGGGKLTAIPVAISLSASFMSSITVLSNPAEVRPTILTCNSPLSGVAVEAFLCLYVHLEWH